MTTETTAAVATPAPLDAKTLLGRVNARIALLRAWLSHHHGDEPYWWARRTTAARVQRERAFLREIANILHVERAHIRGRIHGTRFETLDAQRDWLDSQLYRWCGEAAGYAGLPEQATLHALREGKLSR